MRRSILIIGLIVICLCGFFLFRSPSKKLGSPPGEARTVVPADVASSPAPPPSQSPDSTSTASESRRLTGPERSNVYNRQMESDWRHPIEFYGKVLDETGNPVKEAAVRFQWSDMTDNVASNSSTTESDTGGLFSLHGKFGRSLDVWVTKEGYYAPHAGYKGFLYSIGNDLYSPDISNPVIFNLHKKGQGVELITSQNGVSTQVGVKVPTDGTSVKVDLLNKRPDPSGQLEISQNKPPWQGATNWSFRLSISDGGFVENQDDFQFQAPETGYQPTVQYNFSKSASNWTTQVTKQFYIAFGNPRRYGWLRFESNLGQQTVFLTYGINPDGSQNLEPAN